MSKKVTDAEGAIGESIVNRKGQKMTIVGTPDDDRRRVLVRFDESGHIIKTRYSYFIKGNIIDHESVESLPGEEWRDIVGFEGRYMVSNLGRVKNLPNKAMSKERILTGHMLRGYLGVTMHDASHKQHAKAIHKLVAIAFIPNPDGLPMVNHKDENKLNNRADNLEWCDAKYNANYGSGKLRMIESRRRNGIAKERPWKYKAIDMYSIDGQFIRRFPSVKHAAKELGTSPTMIGTMCQYKEGVKPRKHKVILRYANKE